MAEEILECEITGVDESGSTECIEKETGRKVIIENPTPTRLIIKMTKDNKEQSEP